MTPIQSKVLLHRHAGKQKVYWLTSFDDLNLLVEYSVAFTWACDNNQLDTGCQAQNRNIQIHNNVCAMVFVQRLHEVPLTDYGLIHMSFLWILAHIPTSKLNNKSWIGLHLFHSYLTSPTNKRNSSLHAFSPPQDTCINDPLIISRQLRVFTCISYQWPTTKICVLGFCQTAFSTTSPVNWMACLLNTWSKKT